MRAIKLVKYSIGIFFLYEYFIGSLQYKKIKNNNNDKKHLPSLLYPQPLLQVAQYSITAVQGLYNNTLKAKKRTSLPFKVNLLDLFRNFFFKCSKINKINLIRQT